MPAPKDPRKREEWIKKISERTKQALADPVHHKNQIESHIGYVVKEETKLKLKVAFSGDKNPFYGKQHSQEMKQELKTLQKEVHLRSEWKSKQSESHKKIPKENHSCYGKPKPEETRKRIAETLKVIYQIKENHPRWLGGKSFEPYSSEFNKVLKLHIRERDNYKCQMEGCQRRGHDIHHIDYNKKNCDPKNLITLCMVCHPKTNANREYWKNHFQKVIGEKYKGKSYFNEDEMQNREKSLCYA